MSKNPIACTVASLVVLISAAAGMAQTTLEHDQLLQLGTGWTNPQSFGWTINAENDRLVIAEFQAVFEYLWDEVSSGWVPGRSVVDLPNPVRDVALSGSRIAYLTETTVEVLGPPNLSIPLIHTADSIDLAGGILAVGYIPARMVEIYYVPFDGTPAIFNQALEPAGQATDWDYGFDLAFSADAVFLAVGAPNHFAAPVTGRTYVYVQDLPTAQRDLSVPGPIGLFLDWHLYQHVEIQNAFGRSVALNEDGSLLVVGAPFEDTSQGVGNVGGVFLYDNLDFSYDGVFGGSHENAQLGISVAVQGRIVLGGEYNYDQVVAGPGEAPDGTVHVGSGRGVLFGERSPGSWRRLAYLGGPASSEADQSLGRSAALTPHAAVLGAPERDLDANHNDRGAVFSFPRPELFSDGFESGDTIAW